MADADKQLGVMYNAVGTLKELGYHEWRGCLAQQAYAYAWPSWILDLNENPPDNVTAKQNLHIRNAYMIIMNKTNDHVVANSLKLVKLGDAKAAFKKVHEFFQPDSQAGKTAAFSQFYRATMKTTNTNIMQWVAEVHLRANLLKEAGGEANEQARLSILLDGLLPEFDRINEILNHIEGLTFETACSKLIGYARSHKIECLTKDGEQKLNGKANSFFNAQDANPPNPNNANECRLWKRGSCTYGDRCKFQHIGPGGTIPRKQRNAKREIPKPPTTPEAFMVGSTDTPVMETKCENCSGSHAMQDCPTAKVFTMDSTRNVNYVFMADDSNAGDDNNAGDDSRSCMEARPSGGPSGGSPPTGCAYY